MIRLIFLFTIFSCASAPRAELPAAAEIKTKEFSSSKEAQNFVRNKLNYLKLLFEQSVDPYYGTPKWSGECLKQNHFSDIKEDSGNLFFTAKLFLNDRNESGFCEGKLRDVIFLQCKDEAQTHEIICPPGACPKISCPVKK